MNHVENIVPNVYLALLAHTAVYMFSTYDQSDYWKELYQGILDTEKMISKNNYSYQKFKEHLSQNPIQAIENDKECQD